MLQNEDGLPSSYKYAWSKDAELSLPDFLTKFKPSMVQNDGTKPWIWVRGSDSSVEDVGVEDAIKEASEYLNEVTEKIENVKNDESIPLRSSKKTGAKSKKEVREQIQAEASKKLEEIAVSHGYLSGKWLIFASSDKVDMIWSNIATSIVSGPLSSTSVYLAKVATSPESETSNAQHLICVYMPNVYDKESVTEVMKLLLRNHGVNLSGVKSNLYTSIGIDSKHASGIQSTIWKNSNLIPESESKALKDAFFANLSTPQAVAPVKSDVQAAEVPTTSKVKPKLKLRKKVDDNPFESDNEEPETVPAKKSVTNKAKKSETDNKEPPPAPEPKKGGVKVKAKRASSSDDEDDEEERPKKKRAAAKR